MRVGEAVGGGGQVGFEGGEAVLGGLGPHVTFTFHPDDGTLTDNFGGGQTTYVRASAATP